MNINALESFKTYLKAHLTSLKNPVVIGSMLLSSIILLVSRLVLPQYFNYSTISSLDFSSVGAALDQLENIKYLEPLKHTVHFIGNFLVVFLIALCIFFVGKNKSTSATLLESLMRVLKRVDVVLYIALLAFLISVLSDYIIKAVPFGKLSILIPLALSTTTIALNAYVLPLSLLENASLQNAITLSAQYAQKTWLAVIIGLVCSFGLKDFLQITMEHFADKWIVNQMTTKSKSLYDGLVAAVKGGNTNIQSFSQSLEELSLRAGKLITLIAWLQNIIFSYVSFVLALYFALVLVRFYQKSNSKTV